MIIYEAQTQYVRKEIPTVTLNDAESSFKHGYEFFHKTAQDLNREHLIVCGLSARNNVVFTQILTVGTDNQTLAKPRDIIKHVLLNNCPAFILYHNHPSGDPCPSTQDHRITRQIREAAGVMDLHFHDHIVLGEVQNDPLGLGYYSFRNAGHI